MLNTGLQVFKKLRLLASGELDDGDVASSFTLSDDLFYNSFVRTVGECRGVVTGNSSEYWWATAIKLHLGAIACCCLMVLLTYLFATLLPLRVQHVCAVLCPRSPLQRGCAQPTPCPRLPAIFPAAGLEAEVSAADVVYAVHGLLIGGQGAAAAAREREREEGSGEGACFGDVIDCLIDGLRAPVSRFSYQLVRWA